jgi:hypothetical protein
VSGAKRPIAFESVLSCWHTQGCAHCQNHLAVKAFVPLEGWTHEQAGREEFEVRVCRMERMVKRDSIAE